jgi:hypothetical protein
MANELNLDTMSDEEFEQHMNSLPDEELESNSTETGSGEVDEEVLEEDIEDTDDDSEEEEVADTEEDTQETDETETDEEDTASQTDEEDSDDSDEESDTTEDTPETTEPDYKAFYEQVTKPYKANGREMPGIKSPEDFITALQMASNYAQKTAALKPGIKRIKMLQDITDEELNEMLDFKNRNPEVIKKALLEAKIDPLDIDTDKPVAYQAKDYRISDSDVEFDEVIDSIKGTEEFKVTSQVVSKVWDERSKREMLNNPRLIVALNEEVQMGRYDTIQGMIDQAKALGKTGGKSDLEMYTEIATEMNKEKVQPAPVVTPKVPKVEDPAVKDLKKKAGISTKKPSKVAKKYDPAKLSDDEFLQLLDSGAKFI